MVKVTDWRYECRKREKRIKELEAKNKEQADALAKKFTDCCENVFNTFYPKQSKRIKELEAALQGMVPFIEEDFPKGTGTNHGTCATDEYQQVCDAVIQVLKG